MKKILTGLCLIAFIATANALTVEVQLQWEKAAQSYLNKKDIEVYNIKVVNGDFTRDLSFSYDEELSYAPGEYATYNCEGSADLFSYTVFTVTCEEEESILYDEL